MIKALNDRLKRAELGKAQIFKDLILWPILGEDLQVDLLTLDQALVKGLQVKELESPTVPFLWIKNPLNEKIFLLQGEYLKGGLQNRMLERDMILREQFEGKVPVKCIEQGRWSSMASSGEGGIRRRLRVPAGSHMAFAAGDVASPELRLKASEQSGVWGAVQHVLCASGVRSRSSDYSAAAARFQEEVEEAQREIEIVPNQIGLLVSKPSLSGEERQIHIEFFANHDQLSAYLPKLMSGYLIRKREAAAEREDKALVLAWQEILDLMTRQAEFIERQPVDLGLELGIQTPKLQGSAMLFEGKLVHLFAGTKAA